MDMKTRRVQNFAHLLLRIDHDLALDARLRHVGPAVAGLPLSLALGAPELAKAALRSLVRSQTFFARASLQ